MSSSSRALLLVGCVAVTSLRAVYAPIPEQEQGELLLVSVRAGMSHDSNIFGAPNNEIASTLWTLAPRASLQASLTNRTFLAAAYGLTLDHFKNRPDDRTLDSHEATVRLAHQFNPRATLDLLEAFTVSRNPESLLAGVPVNLDQSFTRNQFDGRFTTELTPRFGVNLKVRSIYFDYRNATLGRSLDRIENLYGVAGDFGFLPETRLVAEYRHQDVYYRKEGELKNKRSDYLMGGVDYAVARTVSLSGRLGAEWRRRAGERDTTAPYAELSGKYDYAPRSFLAAGYAYTLEETSDTLRFNDSQLHRFFANVQHALTGLIVLSGSATFEPAELQGRRGQPDISEDTWRIGAALTYLPQRNWSLSATFDYDRVRSDDPFRQLRRERVGANVTYAF